MKNLQKKIRDKINSLSTVGRFAADIKVRKATLYDFLNDKIEIKLPTLMKIIKPLGMSIQEDLPDRFRVVECVYVDGKTYKKTGIYKGKKIIFCFGTCETSHQGMVLQDRKMGFELVVI
jgi:hypothetical protein